MACGAAYRKEVPAATHSSIKIEESQMASVAVTEIHESNRDVLAEKGRRSCLALGVYVQLKCPRVYIHRGRTSKLAPVFLSLPWGPGDNWENQRRQTSQIEDEEGAVKFVPLRAKVLKKTGKNTLLLLVLANLFVHVWTFTLHTLSSQTPLHLECCCLSAVLALTVNADVLLL